MTVRLEKIDIDRKTISTIVDMPAGVNLLTSYHSNTTMSEQCYNNSVIMPEQHCRQHCSGLNLYYAAQNNYVEACQHAITMLCGFTDVYSQDMRMARGFQLSQYRNIFQRVETTFLNAVKCCE